MSSSFIANASVSPIFAKRRLVKDWKELQQEQENLLTVSALPTSDIYKWRACLKPDNGPYAGTVFHLELQFGDSYPRDPPEIKLFTTIAHPNVFEGWHTNNDIYICLDMLKPYTSKEPYAGWSAAYSVTSVLLQLQSFLFAESIPQDYGGSISSYGVTDPRVTRAIQKAREFTCRIVTSDGETVVHTHSDPWPPLPEKKVALASPMTVDMQCSAPPEIPIAVWRDSVFGFLGPKDIITARNVCSNWRKIVVSYNLFERSQLSCFYSKKTLNDKGCILGVGIVVEYHRNCSGLKSVTSPLDLLSMETFRTEGVCTSVFDKQKFGHLLPLVLNTAHASKARREMETTISDIMKSIPAPSWSGIYGQMPPFERLYPHMILQLMASLMNSMVVQLMNDANEGTEIRRHASEKALEGYCAFHHMLL